jgi:hypothetical protein
MTMSRAIHSHDNYSERWYDYILIFYYRLYQLDLGIYLRLRISKRILIISSYSRSKNIGFRNVYMEFSDL